MTMARDTKRAWPGPGLVGWLRGAKAYVFGLPMIMMDLTKESMTATTPGEISAPVNQFSCMTRYPDASSRVGAATRSGARSSLIAAYSP